MDIIGTLENYLLSYNPPSLNINLEYGFWPSQASCIINHPVLGEIPVGKCQRDSWFQIKNMKKSNPPTARGQFIFGFGHAWEDWCQGKLKDAGVLVSDNKKFTTRISKGLPENESIVISGELDGVVRDPLTQNLEILELKTFYSYVAKKEIIGSTRPPRAGKPKIEHLMQVMIYLDVFKDKQIDTANLFYISRDNIDRKNFIVKLEEVGQQTYPRIDGNLDRTLTLEGIYHRFWQLKTFVDTDVMPQPDYEYNMSQETLTKLYNAGMLNKEETKKFEKDPSKVCKMHFRCSYCDYKDYCIKLQKEEPTNGEIFTEQDPSIEFSEPPF